MTRVTGGSASRARHNKIRKAAKGYRGKRHSTFRLANQAVMKAGQHAYVGRKEKKRDFRRLWITRISIVLRSQGLRYSDIKNRWLHARMEIDRKNLSELAVNHPEVFAKLVEVAQKAEKVVV